MDVYVFSLLKFSILCCNFIGFSMVEVSYSQSVSDTNNNNNNKGKFIYGEFFSNTVIGIQHLGNEISSLSNHFHIHFPNKLSSLQRMRTYTHTHIQYYNK
jgi:hypothetical protein